MRKIYLFCSILFLCSCGTPHVTLNSKFDVTEAKKLMIDGKNTIDGSAVIRQTNGKIQTCAGYPVALVPLTKYAEERMTAIYNNSTRSFSNKKILFKPDELAYHQHMKKTYCDVDGRFSFEKITDGTFFVTTSVGWITPQGVLQGGALMQKVTVKGGEKKKIVLSPY